MSVVNRDTGQPMPESSVRCGGACCRGFYLSMTLEQSTELAQVLRAKRRKGQPLAADEVEHVQIADMIIPLPVNAAGEQTYTCKNLDTSTGLCTIYEKRPGMCRRFPTDQCNYCGFTQGAATTTETIPHVQEAE